MVPSRKELVAKLGISSSKSLVHFISVGHGLIGGLIACLIRGCMVGILYKVRKYLLSVSNFCIGQTSFILGRASSKQLSNLYW